MNSTEITTTEITTAEMKPGNATIANLIIGLGVTGRAVAHALLVRGFEVTAIDDFPTDAARNFAIAGGFQLLETPTPQEVADLVARSERILPSPGIPDAHPAMVAAQRHGIPIRSEFDLAQQWDTRPVAAITGTNGKTTVTTLVTEMLNASGIEAAAVGNTDVPYIAAIDDPNLKVFVVEASSFRLGHSAHFVPKVATWLNFAPDHLDVHDSLAAYEESKAQIFRWQAPSDIAIYNAADPTVRKHLGAAQAVSFDLEQGDFHQEGDYLVDASGHAIVAISELPRRLPHDLANALAAAATAQAMGASAPAIAATLRNFHGLDHRMQFVAELNHIRFYNDSKATVPEAVQTATDGLGTIVLIAGGRNKGLSYKPIVTHANHLRAAVAIGDAAAEVTELMVEHQIPVVNATTMEEAVNKAFAAAEPGDAVLLSPGGTSHDWYRNYEERGHDFIACVNALIHRQTTRVGGKTKQERHVNSNEDRS
ncbi:MAG: UDP-N-acetylmuramoyl-L-alanine--D-glutamate ligase [Acidimicrobiia bacterium]